MSNYLGLGELKEMLGVKTINDLEEDKLIKLVGLLPRVKREDAIEILANLENKDEMSLGILKRLKVLCEEALLNGYEKDTIRSYKKALDALELMIRDKISSFEDTEYCKNEIISISAKLGLSDHLGYSDDLIKALGAPRALLYLIGAALIK